MSVNKSVVSALYVTLFGRASEGTGNKYWVDLANNNNYTVGEVAYHMIRTEAAQKFYEGKIEDNRDFIEHVYATTLNKGLGVDEAGKQYWTSLLNNGFDKSIIVAEILNSAMNPDWVKHSDKATREAHELLVKKVMTSNIVADTISHIPNGELKKSLTRFVELNEKVRSNMDNETLKNSILEEFDRNLVEDELNKSIKDNTKEKVISDFFNISVDEIKDRYKTPDETPNESPKEPEKLPENPKEPENKPEPERQNNNNNDTSGGSGNSSGGGLNQTQPPVNTARIYKDKRQQRLHNA